MSIQGAKPGECVSITATSEDDDKRVWRSFAEFEADGAGCIDLRTHASLRGTYRGVSPMGLFWSMKLASQPESGSTLFAKNTTFMNSVSLELHRKERLAARVSLSRTLIEEGTIVRDLTINSRGEAAEKSENVVGRLFVPRGLGPHPTVVVLSGSGGGFDLDKAAALSRHGCATIALAYFGIPPLPKWLHRVPLDYFEAALAWLAAQQGIDDRRVGILGVSRGAELALLLASRFPQIRAVVAYSPSHVAWAAGGRQKPTGEIIPTWTYRGEPLPFAPLPLRDFMWRSAVPVVALRRPVMFHNLFRAGLKNRAAISASEIPVERIAGPVMLISGGDDHVWPAAEMSQAIERRLKQHKFPHAIERLHYRRAGHMLRYPYLPTTSRQSPNPHLRNARFSFGGTARADAEAQADAWQRATVFFRSNL